MERKLTFETKYYQEKTEELQRKYKHFVLQELHLVKEVDDTTKTEVFFSAAELRMNALSYLISENMISWEIFGKRNFRVLDAARKDCFQIFMHLEKIAHIPIDLPLSDIVKLQSNIITIPSDKRFFFSRKIMLVVALLKEGYGENTKWRWNLTEIEAKSTLTVRNLP